MLTESILFAVPLLVGAALGLLAVGLGWYAARRAMARGRQETARIHEEALQDAESRKRELLLAAEERVLALHEESDKRERELEARDAELEGRLRDEETARSELSRRERDLERRAQQIEQRERDTAEAERVALEQRAESRKTLERVAGLSVDEARRELIAGIEEEARRDAARQARKIEDEARENAEREALNLIIQAAERVDLREAVQSTVAFIALPSDEMKGRIIGREGRNIRALEMATGIDLVVDDTPGAILISSFDPIRREVARVAIERLVEDGRIHPARIEEVVAKVRDELEAIVEQEGNQAAFSLGISDLHPRLARRVGRMKFQSNHGQNLLQHCKEVSLLAAHMGTQVGANVALLQRAGLLHEVGRVDDSVSGHTLLGSAELAARYGEAEEVARVIRSLHPDFEFETIEGIILNTANRMSDNRPGARKDNLEIYVERLRRLEQIASEFEGVEAAYAVKAGKEIRIIVDSDLVSDEQVYDLSRDVVRRIEEELTYPGQIKVSVIRETRAVKYAV